MRNNQNGEAVEPGAWQMTREFTRSFIGFDFMLTGMVFALAIKDEEHPSGRAERVAAYLGNKCFDIGEHILEGFPD